MGSAHILKAAVGTDVHIQLKGNTAICQQLVPALNHMLFQLEPRNAIDQQPANAVIAIIDCHLIALLSQHIGGGKASRSRANNPDRFAALCNRLRWLHPAIFKGCLCDMLFNSADCDRFESFFDDAAAFAQTILRANATTDFRHVIRLG